MLVYMINKRRLRILLLVIPTVLAYFLYITVFTASDDFNATHKPHVEKSWDEKIKSHHLHGLDLHGGPLHNHADAIASETGKGKEQSKKGQMVEKEGGRDSKKENYSSGKKGALNLNGRGFDVLQRTDEVEDERESRNGVVKETQKTVLKEQKEEEEKADEISKHENEKEHVQMEQLEGKEYVQNPSSNLLLTTRKSLPPKGIQYKGGLPSLHYASHQDLQQQPVEKQIQQNNFRSHSETTKATMQQQNPFEGQPDITAASHTHLNMSILKPDSMNKNIILNATIKNDTSPKDKTDENSVIQHHESDAPHNGQIQQHLSETQKSDSQQQKLVLQGRQQQSGFQQHPVPQLGSHQLPSTSQLMGSVQQNNRNQASDQQAAMKGQNQAENGTGHAYMQQSNIQQEPVQKSVNQPGQQPNVQQQLGQQLVNQPGQQPNVQQQLGEQLVNQPGQQPNVQQQLGQQLVNQPGQQPNVHQQLGQQLVNQPGQQPNVQQQLGQQLVNQPGQQPYMEGQEGQQLVNQPGQQPNVQLQEGQQLVNQPGQQPNVQPQEGQQLANQPGQQPNVQLQEGQQLANQPGQQPNVQPQEGQQLVNQPGQQPNVQPQAGQQLVNQPGQQPNVQLQEGQQLVNQPGQQPNAQPQAGQQLVNQPGQQPNAQLQEGQQLVNQPGQQPNAQLQAGQQLVNQPGQQPNVQLQEGQQLVNQPGQQPNAQLQAGQQLVNQPGQQPNVQLQAGQQLVNQPGQQPNVQLQAGQQLVNQPGQQPNVQLQEGQQFVHQPAQKAASQQQQQEVPQGQRRQKFSQQFGQQMPQTGGLGGAPKSATNAEQVLIIADRQYPIPDQPAVPSSIPNWVPVENYIFTATQKEMPINSRYLPTIANGHVGTVVFSDAIYMNGLYNGRLTSSHRARIPSSCAVNITAVEPSQGPLVRLYALNVAEGVFTQVIRGQGYNITQKLYAHRDVPQLLVVEVEVQKDGTTGPNKISLNLNSGTSSSDISYKDGDSGLAGVKYIYGHIKETELAGMTPTESHVFYTEVPRELVVPPMVKKMKWVSITSASYSKKDAEDGFQLGMALAKKNQLYSNHVTAWNEVWKKGRIDVSDNKGLARSVYGCLYYILSSLPLKEDTNWPFIGLSPGDLAHGAYKKDYEGHVFWDQETWMYPPIQMFFSDLAKIMLKTRTRTLDAARHNAIQKRLKGAKYPWESAFTGAETSPSNDTATYEIHINGDISLAVRQYLYSTWDVDFLKNEKGFDMVLGIADFWESRSVIGKGGKLEIHSVDGPDEYHFNVNNSVYTNYVAKISLLLPAYAGKLTGVKVDPKYQKMAENMYIPYDKKLDYHPEYDGFTLGTQVKQADVILLGYPLMMNMSTSTRRNDLAFYEKLTDIKGPTMTWGQFAINWLELKAVSKANRFLKKKFANIVQPFQLWTENSDGSGAVNFITGMGDMLQCVLFGYGGVRLKEDRLDLDPVLPLNSKTMNITGMDYLGASLDLTINEKQMAVTLTHQETNSPPLTLKTYEKQVSYPLKLNSPVKISPQKVAVVATS